MSVDDAAVKSMVDAYRFGYDNSISAAGRPNFPHEMGVLAACSSIQDMPANPSVVAQRFGEQTWAVHQYPSATQESQAAALAKTVMSAWSRGPSSIPTSPYPATSSVPTTPLSPSFNWSLGTGPRHVEPRLQENGWVKKSPQQPQRISTLYTSPPVSLSGYGNGTDGMPEGYCWVAAYDHSQGIRLIDKIPSPPQSGRSSGISRRLSGFGSK